MTEWEALKELTNLCQELAKNHVALVQEVRDLHERVKMLENARKSDAEDREYWSKS